MFVTRDAENISNLLDFIGRHITKNKKAKKEIADQRIKKLIGGKGRERFYLIETKALGEKSLLQYLVDNGKLMLKQREELLDLLSKKIE